MYFLLKMGIFQCHVSFQGCNPTFFFSKQCRRKKTRRRWGEMKFFCPLTKICTATPEKMREHMEGELYKQFVAKDTGMQKIKELFGTVGCVFFGWFFVVHLLKLDGKSLFSDIKRGGGGSSQSTSPKSEGFGWLILCLMDGEQNNYWGENLHESPENERLESNHWWFVEDFPFPLGVFQVPC